jgi:nucleoside-diphosphate-sugar epimerase
MLIENQLYLSELERINQTQMDWTRIDGHSFLVIGATGLIGSYLIDTLMWRNKNQAANIKIYAMGRHLQGLEQRFEQYLNDEYFQVVEADVVNPLPEIGQIDYIIHGASNTHPRAYATDPIGTIMTNIVGTKQVLDYATKENTTRTLFLSSVEIYGENQGDSEKFDEHSLGYIDSNSLRGGYPEAKRASESLIQAYIAQKGIDVVIPRLSRTFGPTMLMNDSKAASQFLKNAVNGEEIVLKSAGSQLFSYTYVGDVVSALLFLLLNGENGAAYNVAVDEYNVRLKELAAKIAQIGQTEVIFDLPDAEEQKGFSKASLALMNADKINQFGWHSLFTIQEALEHTVQILKDESKVNRS